MKPRWVTVVIAVAVAALCGPLAVAGDATVRGAAGPAITAGSWRDAIEVPGLGTLNAGGRAGVWSVSCGSAGNCAAGGFYADSPATYQAFVVSERNGRWGEAVEVPGSRMLNAGGAAEVRSVSCGAVGNCAAAGRYADRSGHSQAFVVSERSGRWGTAIEVPGTGTLNAGGDASVTSVSCGAAGNCAAGGFYLDVSGHTQAFVVRQTNGHWGKAVEVPGSGALNAGGRAGVRSVSCPSAGNCAAGGFYANSPTTYQAFVVSERNGRWGRAIEVPGSGALNAGGDASVNSVSCGAVGNCAAAGGYDDAFGGSQMFVVSERNGRWGRAIEVPGSGALNAGGNAFASSVSCGAVGNCAAAGSYADRSGHSHAFVVSERSGRWGEAVEVPGSRMLNAGGAAEVRSVSCGSAGNCAAGGFYVLHGTDDFQAFVVSEMSGRWGTAIEVPGSGALNAGTYASVYSLSCPSAGDCAAGGGYSDRSAHHQGFVVSQT